MALANNELLLRPLSAADAMSRIGRFLAALPDGHHVTIEFKATFDGVDFTFAGQTGKVEGRTPLQDALEKLAHFPELGIRTFVLKFKKNSQTQHEPTITYTNYDSLFYKFVFFQPQSLLPDMATVYGALRSAFEISAASELISASYPEPFQLLAKHQFKTVADLEAIIVRIGEYGAQQISRNDDHIKKLTDRLQETHLKQSAALEDEYRKKLAVLEDQRTEFTDRVAKFDLRENAVVRRDLVPKLMEELDKQKTIELSKATTAKAAPIFWSLISAMIVGVALTAAGVVYLFKESEPTLHPYPLVSTGLLLFASCLIYFLRWNHRWLNAHALPEMDNLRIRKDVLRASWIAELIFEGKKNNVDSLPAELLDKYASGLFVSPASEDINHPAEEVVKLIGRLRKIGVGPIKIEIGGDRDKK